jgi:hypothetical protein
MKPYLEQRNEKIRKDYRKLVVQYKRAGERKPSAKAIEELVHKYNAWALEFETIRRIVLDPNYGKTPEAKTAEPEKPEPITKRIARKLERKRRKQLRSASSDGNQPQNPENVNIPSLPQPTVGGKG